MKNFIKYNINNVKGTRNAVSIERDPSKSPPQKYYSPGKQRPMNTRLSDIEQKISQITQNHHQEIIDQLSSIKEDIRLIKSHIFDQKYHHTEKMSTQGNAPWE